jgi:cytoskeletal protein RodZ
VKESAMNEGADDERGLFPSSVGEQLAAERARQHLELSDVAARTRIPLRHLEAIESGKHGGLPALPYSAGFVKSYANMLGLDGNALSRAFRAQIGDERRGHFEPEAYEPVDPSRVPSRLLAMIALGVALLLGMVYLLLRFEGDNRDLAKLAADTTQDSRPMPLRPPPPAAAPAAPVVPTGPISIVADQDIWIKVTDNADGRILFKDILKAGQSYVVPDDAVDPSLRILKPQRIKVMIGTTGLPPVGEPDQLVPAYSLKRDALVAIATAQPAEAPAVPDAASNAAAGDAADLPGTPVTPPAAADAPPRRLPTHRTPRVQEPAASPLDSSEPVRDSDQLPQP